MRRLISLCLALGLVLALGLPGLAGEPAPEDSPVSEAPAPENTPEPEDSPQPEATPAPEESTAPAGSPEPEVTPEPEAAESPAPTVSPEPGGSPAPSPAASASPAPAAPRETAGAEPAVDGVINVETPSLSSVVVNPYRMPVELEGVQSREPIVSKTETLRNYSAFPVRVDVSAVGSAPPESAAVFVYEPPGDDAADKAVFMYLEFQSGLSPQWSGWFSDSQSQALVGGPKKESVLTLGAGTEEGPGCGVFRLFGSVAPNPAEAWTSLDTVNVEVYFTFTAQPSEGTEAPKPADTPKPSEAAKPSEAETTPEKK